MGDIIHALPAVASLKRSLSRLAPHLGRRTEMGAAARRQPVHRPPRVAAPRYACGPSRKLAQPCAPSATISRSISKASSSPRWQPPPRAPAASSASIAASFASAPPRSSTPTRRSAAPRTWWIRTSTWPPPPAPPLCCGRSRCRAGRPEGALPPGDFVLASPLAGWRAKQWPIEHYQALAARLERELGIPLVLDGPPGSGLDALLRPARLDPRHPPRRGRSGRR